MTSDDQSIPSEARVRDEMQSQHPELATEIDGAIHTLRKLKKITGTLLTDSSVASTPGAPEASPLAQGTVASDSSTDEDLATFELDEERLRAASTLAAGESFGRYQITRQLGSGAMGAVYLAYDTNLQRFVALKTPFLGNQPKVIQRFYREAHTLAQVRSPYICPIYDVDQISGIPYLSMAFIDGKPLSRALREGLLREPARIAVLVQKIARGMQKAHEQNIIHRDLKPDNIMIDADGEPIVMDFGLARRIDEAVKVTATGGILGTPAYMSPEQAEGDPKNIGAATDIYSLGVILYELLTGRLPFEGSFVSVLRKIGQEAPPRPSAVCTEVGADSPLEQICLKMLAKAPADRYPSMAAVGDALEQLNAPAAPPPPPASRSVRAWAWLKNLFVSRPAPTSAAAAPAAESVPNLPAGHSSASAAPARAAGSATQWTSLSNEPSQTVAEPSPDAVGRTQELPSSSQTVNLTSAHNASADGTQTDTVE